MDIQKEREAFESAMQELSGGQTKNDVNPVTGEYQYGVMQVMWSVWQKARAVPEGYVLMPKEPTDAMLFAASGRDIVAEHYGDENILWPELRETWKAMITAAQEPAND